MITLKRTKLLKIMTILLFSVLMSNCGKYNIFKDDELSIQRTLYTGNELRIDGYYYYKWGNPERSTIYFFYQNGVLLGGDSPLTSEIAATEQEFANGTYYSHINEIKYAWGVYIIEGNLIRFERWYPSDPPLKAFVKAGEILNDTTFVIKEIYRMQKGKKTEAKNINQTYHFREFSPKPDSTNSFIK